MVIFRARALSFAVVRSLAVVAGVLTCASAAEAQAMITLEQAVKDCRLIPDKSTRLGCYDRAIDAANAPPARQSMVPAPPASVALATAPAPASPPAPKVAPTPNTAPPPAPSLPPAAVSAAPSAASQPPVKTATGVDGVAVQVVSASINGNRVLSVVTSDGETWLQTDNTEFARVPEAGETIVITKNVFGKRTCHIQRLAAFSCRSQK